MMDGLIKFRHHHLLIDTIVNLDEPKPMVGDGQRAQWR